jgi:ATP-dependent DNA ligase
MIQDTQLRSERVRLSFVEPMQVMPVRKLPDSGQWAHEAKLDGYRCLVAKRGASVVLWSRRGTGFTQRFPSIARACETLPPDTLIDAEVIVVDENGRCSFNALQHKRHAVISSYMPSIFWSIGAKTQCVCRSRNAASSSPSRCGMFDTR